MEDLETKDKILKGAEELFTKYGVRSISMDDIARHLAVSKKTLYQHFVDKEDIVTMTSKQHIEKISKEFERIRERAKNAIDELAGLSICMKREMEDINPSLLFDLQKYHPKAWAVWIDHKNNFIRNSVARNLRQGIEEGYFRPDINSNIIASMRIELVEIAFDERIFPREEFKLPEVQLQIFDHFVYGIVTDKGRKLYQNFKEELNHTPSTIL